jgi:hypothetical protein
VQVTSSTLPPLPIFITAHPKAERVPEAVIDRILRRVARHADGWQTDATPVRNLWVAL